MSERFLSYKELKCEGIPYCREHIWRMEQIGKFPRRVQLSAARIAWLKSEIDAWKAARIAERDAQVVA